MFFPFQKLRHEKYLALEVMTYVEHPDVLKFMFIVNKETRLFLLTNFIVVRNGFVNAGLVTFYFRHNFNSYMQLEKLYFQALSRNIENRIITIKLEIYDKDNLNIINHIVNWIRDQK